MGGVNFQDTLVAVYGISIGIKRYYLCIVFHLLDICVVNAWLLYLHCSQRGITKCQALYHLPVRNSTHSSQGKEKVPVGK
jgi:hypothetical protein